MAIESSVLASLEAEANEHRTLGDEHHKLGDKHHSRADEIEQAIILLVGKPTAEMSVGRAVAKARVIGVGGSVVSAVGRSGRKGKPPGAMSQRWRGNFAEIIRMVPPPFMFGFNHVQTVVKLREGREVRPSEIHRLFEGNVKHGYLVRPSRDLYQPTQKLIELIGLMKHEGPPVDAEGPNAGGVAERLNAPDYESGGVAVEVTPVGSNPTASALTPENEPLFRAALGFPQPLTPND